MNLSPKDGKAAPPRGSRQETTQAF